MVFRIVATYANRRKTAYNLALVLQKERFAPVVNACYALDNHDIGASQQLIAKML